MRLMNNGEDLVTEDNPTWMMMSAVQSFKLWSKHIQHMKNLITEASLASQ